MMPPFDKTMVIENAPLADWTYLRAFDTAAECETSRWELGQAYRRARDPIGERAANLARCFPSESIQFK